MGNNVTLNDIKSGDRVRFWYEDVVNSVNPYTGHARTKSGARIRMTKGKGYDAVGDNAILFKAEIIEKAKPVIVFKAGQVWKCNGITYMIIGGPGGLKAYTPDDVMFTITQLQGMDNMLHMYGDK